MSHFISTLYNWWITSILCFHDDRVWGAWKAIIRMPVMLSHPLEWISRHYECSESLLAIACVSQNIRFLLISCLSHWRQDQIHAPSTHLLFLLFGSSGKEWLLFLGITTRILLVERACRITQRLVADVTTDKTNTHVLSPHQDPHPRHVHSTSPDPS